MVYVRDQILVENQEPSFEVLDLGSIDTYDEKTHSLVVDFQKAKKRKVSLLHHPFHFHKLLLLIDFIDKNLAKTHPNIDVN